MSRAFVAAASLLVAACASEPPAADGVAEGITTLAVVTLQDGDMALLDGVRMPLDAVVLRLRLRARAMDAAQLASFGVHVVADAAVPETAEPGIMAARNRLLDEIQVMEIGYVKY